MNSGILNGNKGVMDKGLREYLGISWGIFGISWNILGYLGIFGDIRFLAVNKEQITLNAHPGLDGL